MYTYSLFKLRLLKLSYCRWRSKKKQQKKGLVGKDKFVVFLKRHFLPRPRFPFCCFSSIATADRVCGTANALPFVQRICSIEVLHTGACCRWQFVDVWETMLCTKSNGSKIWERDVRHTPELPGLEYTTSVDWQSQWKKRSFSSRVAEFEI